MRPRPARPALARPAPAQPALARPELAAAARAVLLPFACLLSLATAFAQTAPTAPVTPQPPAPVRPPRVVPPGVHTAGVSLPLEQLKKDAVIPVAGTPDWSVVTADSVWVASARANHVVQIVAATSQPGLIADVERPCSGLAFGFGSVWAPSCLKKEIERIDPVTGKITAAIAADAANSEGGITTGAGSVWFVVKPARLVRIDPASNAVVASVDLPAGSENPLFADGAVWVSSFADGKLLKVDPATMTIAGSTAVGPKPRFLTAGAGSVWTLNQGDGTMSRVDTKTGKLVATIACGLSGGGGEITFGAGSVWATLFDFPLTQVDASTNTVTRQWGGQGGDGLRFGFGSLWLSNLRQGNVWRIPPQQ